MLKKALILFAVSSICLQSYSQDKANLQQIFLEAEYFFMKGEYRDALPLYLGLFKKLPDNHNIAYRIGACCLNIPDRKDLSIDYLSFAVRNLSAKVVEGTINQKPAPYDALFDLGKAYRINRMFEKAKEFYNKYLDTLLPDDSENRNFVVNEIRVCDEAEELISTPVKFSKQNLGEPVNTSGSEFNSVVSADGKVLAYMVSLKFYNAIMVSRLAGNKWSNPVNITQDLEADGDLFVSGLSSDGNMLFVSKDNDLESDIYFSRFNGSGWTKIQMFEYPVNTRYWESHGFMAEDGKSLIFASDRPGGYGGLDLYISFMENGKWNEPVNLGPVINTRFNEDRPFLINEGKTLFFSSQGHRNIGGYDIFRADRTNDGKWSDPRNIGYPLNDTDDNIFFMPTGKGESGYYSFYRESDDGGNEDICLVTFGEK